MGSETRELPVLPLSFGLLVIVVVILGTEIFGLEWNAGQLALTLLAVILLSVGLIFVGRRLLN